MLDEIHLEQLTLDNEQLTLEKEETHVGTTTESYSEGQETDNMESHAVQSSVNTNVVSMDTEYLEGQTPLDRAETDSNEIPFKMNDCDLHTIWSDHYDGYYWYCYQLYQQQQVIEDKKEEESSDEKEDAMVRVYTIFARVYLDVHRLHVCMYTNEGNSF